MDTDSNGGFDEKVLFIPENYQTVLQIENNDLTGNGEDVITHRYLWTPNTQDKLLAGSTSEKTLWTLTDHLGSVRDIVEMAIPGLEIIAHIVYDAYGNEISGTNPVLFGYTGKAFDASTGLQNNINRWYDSTIGRWLTTDPIGFNAGDANLYRYVGNRSMIAYDPLGLWLQVADGGNQWMAEAGDTFEALVPLVNGKLDAVANQYCVKPMPGNREVFVLVEGKKVKRRQADESAMKAAWKDGSPAACGVYDASNMVSTDGKTLRMSIGGDGQKKDEKFIAVMDSYFMTSIRNVSARVAYEKIKTTSNQGITPIGEMMIIAHSSLGSLNIGDMAGRGGLVFSLNTILDQAGKEKLGGQNRNVSLSGQRNWIDAKNGRMPVIGWFSTDARVQFLGCYTETFASAFANLYLRGDAVAMGTKVYMHGAGKNGVYTFSYAEEFDELTKKPKLKAVANNDLLTSQKIWNTFNAKK